LSKGGRKIFAKVSFFPNLAEFVFQH